MEELALKWMTGKDAVAVWLLALAILILLAVTLRQGDWPGSLDSPCWTCRSDSCY